MFDWQTLIAIAALGVAAATFLNRVFTGSLSRSEHEEFKSRINDEIQRIIRNQEARLVIREFESWREQVRLDLDLVRQSVNHLDTNKPTTGELEQATQALEARIRNIEQELMATQNHP